MAIPEKPTTRKEKYLAKIAGQNVPLPDHPITREEAYLEEIAKKGGGDPITVDDELSATSTNPVQNKVIKGTLDGKVDTADVGTANGVAELDANGKVPSSQLPSYVDDVVEGYYKEDVDRFYEESTYETIIPPEGGKAWVDISSNRSFRWTGSGYVRVDEGVQLGETSSSAYRGDRGKTAYDTSQANKTAIGTLASLVTTAKDNLVNAINEVKNALSNKVDKVAGKGLSTNDYTNEEKDKIEGIEVMTGASSSSAGTSGLTPKPSAGDQNKFLRGDGTWQNGGSTTVSVSRSGTASASAVSKQNITVDGVAYEIDGTKYMETSITTSTSSSVNATFSNSAITTSSVIDVYTSQYGLNHSNISVSSGSCTVTFPAQSSAATVTVRIYIR